MKTFEFRCTSCGATSESQRPVADFCCPVCGGALRRVYSNFSVGSGWVPHFNHSVGSYVRSERDFREQLKIQSAEQSHRMGQNIDLVPIHPQDNPPPGALEQREATEKVMREHGMTEPKKLIIPMKGKK